MEVRDQLSVADAPGLAGTAVLRVDGELDVATAPRLTAEVDARLADHPRELVLDLRGVGLMDSSGAGALLGVRRRCERLGARLVVVVVEGPVRRLLRRLQLDSLFSLVVPTA
jgi:anti-sigma B factor antagonist